MLCYTLVKASGGAAVWVVGSHFFERKTLPFSNIFGETKQLLREL